jgi:hypothetical protein
MAKPITVSIPHELPEAEVKRRLVEAIADARTRHADLLKDAREVWQSDDRMQFSASAMGQTISGSIRIDPTHVHLTVMLPMLLSMFAAKLIPQIESEGQKLLKK